MKPETLEQAFEGCDGVFHVAAVYAFVSKNPEEDIIKPACEGVVHMMHAAAKCTIKKVVMTSSVAAVGSTLSRADVLDENTYNRGAVDPYFYAKTQSELKAWQLAEKLGIKLVTILPGGILGGGFFKHTPSTQLVDNLLYSKIPVSLRGCQSFVDVSDVATAHLITYENEQAEGRYIATTASASMMELAGMMRRFRPKIWGPFLEIPRSLEPIAGPADAFRAFMLGEDQMISRKSIAEMAGKFQVYSNKKLKSLGWSPRPFEETLLETVVWIEQHDKLFF
jgi:dihydroflavonol-4-reductase